MRGIFSTAMRRPGFAAKLFIGLVAAGALFVDVAAAAEGNEGSVNAATGLSDLTLSNFFTAGWGEPYVHREREDGTPDMALLKVTTNFLERELRLDYARTVDVKHSRFQDTDFARALIAYGLDRRIMLEAITNYQWNTPRTGAGASGAGGGLLTRFQLVDTELSSYSFQVSANEPNRSIGQTQTSIQYALAGFNDLYPLLGLARVGLYYSVVYESLLGNHAKGARESDIAYDISLAKTWTPYRTPVFGNFTTFLEALATTDLDGSNRGHTVATLTPGVRFWFYPKNSIIAGVDVPVSHPLPFDKVYRVTYILNF